VLDSPLGYAQRFKLRCFHFYSILFSSFLTWSLLYKERSCFIEEVHFLRCKKLLVVLILWSPSLSSSFLPRVSWKAHAMFWKHISCTLWLVITMRNCHVAECRLVSRFSRNVIKVPASFIRSVFWHSIEPSHSPVRNRRGW